MAGMPRSEKILKIFIAGFRKLAILKTVLGGTAGHRGNRRGGLHFL